MRRQRAGRSPWISAAADRQAYGSAAASPGELLELDRRLALVRDALAHAEQRRDRVEQAAHARRAAARSPRGSGGRSAPALERHRPAGRARGRRPRRATARGSPPRRRAAARARGARRARTSRGRSAAARRPRACRRCRSRCRRTRARAPGRCSPCSARHAAACAWWCWTPTSSASCSCAQRVDEVVGVQVVRDHLAARRRASRGRASRSARNARVRLLGVEVAEVRPRGRRRSSARDAEGALQLGADGDDAAAAPRTGSGSASGA